VALLLSLWVHVVLYSGEFLTKTTAAENGQQSRKSLENGIYHSMYVQVKNVQFSLQIVPLV
jgi:hypothetical protein